MSFFYKKLQLLLLLALFGPATYATTYTAIATGNYTSASTWQGGLIPPTVFTGGDTLNIPFTRTVTCNSDITFTGSSASDVCMIGGILRMPGNTLRIQNAKLTGTGRVEADSFGGDFSYGFGFNGSIAVNSMDGSTISGNTNVVFDVADLLYVADSMQLDHGTLNMGPNTVIALNGSMTQTQPTLRVQGSASISFNGSYDVLYMGDKIYAGVELGSIHLDNIIVDMNSSTSQVLLNQNLTVTGKLNIQSGTFVLNNFNLKFDPTSDLEMGATGFFKSSAASDINIESTATLTSPFRFDANGYDVDEFRMNTNNTVKLNSNLNITGYLDILKGKIDVQTYTLKMPLTFNFTGYDKDRYIITEGGGHVSADAIAGSTSPVTVFYPIGTATQYMPCLVTASSTYYDLVARVTPGVKEHGLTGTNWAATKPLVNATWLIGNTNGNVDIDLELTWFPSAEVNGFDKTNGVYISHYATNNKWDADIKKAPTAYTDGSYSAKRTGIKQWGNFAVFDKNTVGIEDVTNQLKTNIYPNPASNMATLGMNLQSPQTLTVTITDITGKVAHNTKPTLYSTGESEIHIPLHHMSPGNYFVIVKDNSGNMLWSGKLVHQ